MAEEEEEEDPWEKHREILKKNFQTPGPVPALISHPELYQYAVLEFLNNFPGAPPDAIRFLGNVQSVVFALKFTCLCAVDLSGNMMGFFRVPKEKREIFKKYVTSENPEEFLEFIRMAIQLMVIQSCKYHTLVAKFPPEIANDAKTLERAIRKFCENFPAEYVFRGPRMPDGRVRMIFQVPEIIKLEEIKQMAAEMTNNDDAPSFIKEDSLPKIITEDDEDDPNECVICREQDINSLLLPCGHLAMCAECAKKVQICPMCRGEIEHVVEDVFMIGSLRLRDSTESLRSLTTKATRK